jgi:hypothetical protein
MKTLMCLLAVALPFLIPFAAMKIPVGAFDGVRTLQTAVLVSCPFIGLLASIGIATIKKEGKWLYVVTGILYGIQSFFAILALNMRWT